MTSLYARIGGLSIVEDRKVSLQTPKLQEYLTHSTHPSDQNVAYFLYIHIQIPTSHRIFMYSYILHISCYDAYPTAHDQTAPYTMLPLRTYVHYPQRRQLFQHFSQIIHARNVAPSFVHIASYHRIYSNIVYIHILKHTLC